MFSLTFNLNSYCKRASLNLEPIPTSYSEIFLFIPLTMYNIRMDMCLILLTGVLVHSIKSSWRAVLCPRIISLETPHLHLQLAYIIHWPGFIIIVVIGHSAEAACPLLMGDSTFRQVLYRPCTPDSVFRNPRRNTSCVKVFTFKNFHIDQVGSLGRRKEPSSHFPI